VAPSLNVVELKKAKGDTQTVQIINNSVYKSYSVHGAEGRRSGWWGGGGGGPL
jgi:hypothetical protein